MLKSYFFSWKIFYKALLSVMMILLFLACDEQKVNDDSSDIDTDDDTDNDTNKGTDADTGADTNKGTDTDKDTQKDTNEDTDNKGDIEGCGFDDSLTWSIWDNEATIWQFVSADEDTCVKLSRRNDSEPDWMYKAVPYTLLSFTVSHAGESVIIEDEDYLEWDSTHHNWSDTATAEADGVRYVLEKVFLVDDDDMFRFDLTATNIASETVIFGPIVLLPYAP